MGYFASSALALHFLSLHPAIQPAVLCLYVFALLYSLPFLAGFRFSVSLLNICASLTGQV